MSNKHVTVRLPKYQIAWLDEQPEASRTAAVRRCIAAEMKQSASEVELAGELEAAWNVLCEAGLDYGKAFMLPVGRAETRLADRLNTPKDDVRHSYLEPLRQVGVVDVRCGRVWVAKPPWDGEEAAHA